MPFVYRETAIWPEGNGYCTSKGEAMPDIPLSRHASVRCANRAIDEQIINLIVDHGREDYDHRGGCRMYLGRTEKRRLAHSAPDLFRAYGRKLDTVVVLSSNDPHQVITAYVRNRK